MLFFNLLLLLNLFQLSKVSAFLAQLKAAFLFLLAFMTFAPTYGGLSLFLILILICWIIVSISLFLKMVCFFKEICLLQVPLHTGRIHFGQSCRQYGVWLWTSHKVLLIRISTESGLTWMDDITSTYRFNLVVRVC